MGRPFLASTSDTDAVRTTRSAYNKPLYQNLVLICVEVVCPSLLVSDKRRIGNDVSADRATRAQYTERPDLTNYSSTRQQNSKSPKAGLQSAQCELNTGSLEEAQQSNVTLEYTVDRIVKHVGTGENMRYVVRRYG